MANIQKLTPDRDLQCYFFEPSAIAAMSNTSDSGFTVSGTWRQQFDWAVIEWNRDNTHEHPAFRNLPDGDLSGLVLNYTETRTNCVPMDSDLFATVDWPSMRVWATPGGGVETVYWVSLKAHATAGAGSYQCAYADFTISGSPGAGDFAGLAFFQEQYTYEVFGGDTTATIITNLAASINAFSTLLKATATGSTIRVFYTAGQPILSSTAGVNGNRFGMYSFATGSETWDASSKTFANGTSPTKWQVSLDFGTLQGTLTPDLAGPAFAIPTNNIRKMRWTYAADLQAAAYDRSEFEVVVSDWTVTGTNRIYSVPGPGSRRIEDNAFGVIYSSGWTETRGNYSGGTIHYSTTPGSSVTYSYRAIYSHTLYIGMRFVGTGAGVNIAVDGTAAASVNLLIAQEDVLFRYPVGNYGTGPHTVTVTHAGPSGNDFYFDFFELAVPSTDLPVFPAEPGITLATDWDTEHSLALAPERTAWMIDSLGFTGRQNHYVGALWFYELANPGNVYASGTVTFTGTPAFSSTVTVVIGQGGADLTLEKVVHEGMTADMVALAFAIELNRGYTGVWASAAGNAVTIQTRLLGLAGDSTTISASTTSGGFAATASGTNFTGGADGAWFTDLIASPRLNRAVRDWSLSFFTALVGYGIDTAASFSMELGNGDPSAAAGIAQVGPSGDPILLPTPSLQTNFSPTSLAFWNEVYLEMANIQSAAGLRPYLQFGEVQWWYFPDDGDGHAFSGMGFYDAWNQGEFLADYGRAMTVFLTNVSDPASFPDEVAYLVSTLGSFTNAIMSFVRATLSTCRFEVLYPNDTNRTSFNQAINYPPADWTPAALTCLKTESFGYTLGHDLDLAEQTIDLGVALGFPATQRSHLVGIGDSTTAWLKEVRSAAGKGFESVVLFALDQYCLIGYATPLPQSFRRSVRMGS